MSAPEDPSGPWSAAPPPPRVAPPAEGGWGRRLGRRRSRLTLLAVVVAAVLVLAATAVVAGAWTERETRAVPLCGASETVEVVVAPDLAPAVRAAAQEAAGTPLSTGVCVDVEVVAEDPVVTAAALAEGTLTPVPHLWVPDSSLWVGRAEPDDGRVGLSVLGSLVETPVVLATSPEAAASAGWLAAEPTWSEALTSGRALVPADLAGSAVALQTLVAVQAGAADGDAARSALAAAAVALDRSGAAGGATAQVALTDLAAGGADAALVPATEQQVFQANRGAERTLAVGVQPRDAVTVLDHPLVRLDTPEREAGVSAAAVEGVVRLLEQQGRVAAVAEGFRPPPDSGAAASPAPSPGEAEGTADPVVVPPPSPEDVERLLAQLEEVGRPSRVLAVFDASASMRAVTASGATRAEIARDAAKSSLALFPDSAAVGLWFFAVDMQAGGTDWVEVVPLRDLDAEVGDGDQREALADGADTLTERLTPGGTGLYDTTLAAVRALREDHDPEASNTVVLVTDGREENPAGIGLEELLSTLAAEADPERPVRVVAIGLSVDVDADELTAIAEATGGAAYLAERPEDFQTVLFDALRRR